MGRSVSVAASPIKSIQTGYVNTGTVSTGTGEETRYLDVTISAVNPAKAVIEFIGGSGNNASNSMNYNGANSFKCTTRFVNATTLRIMTLNTATTTIVGRWTVVEYN